MFKKSFWLLLFVFVLMSLSAFAIQPSSEYSKIYLNPFYRASMAAGTNYTYTLNLSTPDGISKVNSAIINFQVYLTPTVTFNIWVDNQPCNTASYTVSTTYASSGQGLITFDCSNIINSQGIYSIKIRPTSANTGASTAWIDVSYVNQQDNYVSSVGSVDNVKSVDKVNEDKVEVHGTDYFVGETAKVWVQLLNSSYEEIEDATCFVDIYYPNNEILYEREYMTYYEDGIFYKDLLVPDMIGVYPVIALCYYRTSQTVLNPTNAQAIVYTAVEGDYTRLFLNDGNEWKIEEGLVGTNYQIAFNVTFSGITLSSLDTELIITWEGKWDSVTEDDITVYIYNFSSQKWLSLPNKIIDTAGVQLEYSNSVSIPQGSNLTKMGLVSSNGIAYLKFNDTTGIIDAAKTKIENDQIILRMVSLSGGQWQQVKGSSELNVKSDTGYLFRVRTLCGDDTNRCSYFSEDRALLDLPEGILVENITFTTLFYDEYESTYVYSTPFSMDCTSLVSAIMYSDGVQTDIIGDLSFSLGDKDNCDIGIPVIFDGSIGTIFIELKFDNFQKWEIDWIDDQVMVYNKTLIEYCDYFDYSYSDYGGIPLKYFPCDNSSDINYIFCSRVYDDLYWYDYYYQLSQNVTLSGEYESYIIESRIYQQQFENYYDIVTNIQDLNYTQISIRMINLTSTNVWNYSTRTLTSYPNLTAAINTTQVASAVWNYDGNIVTNILSQFANYIWSAARDVIQVIS